jgi:peptidyl-prolyl cis-trans isomerase D
MPGGLANRTARLYFPALFALDGLMLASFRRHLNSWVARLFFMLLVAVFVLWGVGDVIRNLGKGDGSVATVGGRKIDAPEVQSLYQRQLAEVSHMFGNTSEPTTEIRRAVAAQAIERVVTQAAIEEEVTRLGLAVSDDAVRQAVYDIPQLRGPDGKFSRQNLETVLRNNGLTEPRFLALMRSDVGQRQLMEAVQAGVAVPDTEAKQVFAFQNEKRVADGVEVPLAAQPAPPEPTAAQLQRWYDNHPDSYRTPEYRRIRAVVLSPETISKDISVSDDELRAAWEQHRSEYQTPEKRSVDVITAPDEAKAAVLAQQWQNGADWDAMQKTAAAAGATPVELADAPKTDFPSADLADAVFSAKEGAVTGPVKAALGYYVLRVTKLTPGSGATFDDAKEMLRARVVADRAADLIDDRANKIDQMLASGTAMQDLPGDMGLGAVTGTLDAQGITEEGTPAPVPGSPPLKQALVQAAFTLKPGDPPRLTQAPQDNGAPPAYYAVEVENIIPPSKKPFDAVQADVKQAWTADATRHEAEEQAAKVLSAVKGGQSIEDAATVAGLTVRKFPPVGRSAPVEGVPAPLVQPLFGLKKGEPAMVETPDGFIVAVLADVQVPDPAADPVGFGQVRDALNRAMAQDVQASFAVAVRNQAKPRINRDAIDMIAQAGQ